MLPVIDVTVCMLFVWPVVCLDAYHGRKDVPMCGCCFGFIVRISDNVCFWVHF